MALLCQRLSVSWACLTALSADGEVFQHIGSAYLVEAKIGTCSFSSCRTNSGLPPVSGPGRGPPSRTSSTNSIAGLSTVEVGMSDPHLLRGSDTSIEAAAFPNQPLMLSDPGSAAAPASSVTATAPSGTPGALSNGQQPALQQPAIWLSSGAEQDLPQAPQLQQQPQSSPSQPQTGDRLAGEVPPVSTWPLDWQLLYRERGLRAFACLPVTATNGSGTVIGCLSLGSIEPLDWSRQFWAGSTRLITGWAAGAITTTRATARATFYSRLFGATNLDGLARAFAYDMPVFLADGAAGPGTALPEVRLALVSSRLQHAVVYAAPLLQVSGRLGLRPMHHLGGTAAGGYANGGGGGGPLITFGITSGPSGSGASMAGLVLGSANSLGTDRGLVLAGVGPTAHPAAAAARSGGYDTLDCMVLGTALDVDEQASCSSSNSAGGGGSARRAGNHDGGKSPGPGEAGATGAAAQEAPPVDCVKISTDSTLLMSVLEAGDIMIIKDALQYFGGGRMVARDLALNNTRPATAGTLVILPLVHRCRSLGCAYVFARNEFNLTFSRAAWGDLAAMLSRAVFGQLVGKLRHEWYAVLSEDPESHGPQFRGGRSFGAGGVGGRGRVRRTTTGNSLCSNASSLRPSFELPSRSAEQAAGAGGAGKEAAAALAAAAAVLEYAGFMLPDGDDGPAGAAPAASRSLGATTSSSSPRHRIPPEHATAGNAGGGSGGSGGVGGNLESSEPSAAGGVPMATAAVATSRPPGSDPPSTSPGSLSFRLPQDRRAGDVQAAAAGPDGEQRSRPVSQTAPATSGGSEQRCPSHGKIVRTLEALGAEVPRPGSPGAALPARSGSGGHDAAVAEGIGGGGGGAAAAAAAGVVAAEPTGGTGEGAEVDADDAEEISGSSRELQGWPELVDILYDMHRTRNVSVYLAAYRGQAVAVKMMRSNTSMDGRPSHLESEALTIAAQQQLSSVRHPNVLRVLLVYPLVYEVVAGKTQRMHGAGGAAGGNNSFVAHGGNAAGASALAHAQGQAQQLQLQQHQQLLLQQQSGLGLAPLNMMAHAMSDLLSGAGAADASGGGVYLTAVLPRREKFKRGLALMLELFPSLSLREAMQKRMLVAAPDAAGGGLSFAEQLGAAVQYTYVTSSQTTVLSDAGHLGTPTGGQLCSGGMGTGGGGAAHAPPFLPSLPEVASGNDLVFNVDSSPGLAMTGASNSGGANAGAFGSGTGGGHGHSAPPMQLLLAILSQVAAGMAALHSAGLAHGELRPENVLLALPHGGCSHENSGLQERTGTGEVVGGGSTPRVSPTPQRAGSGGVTTAAVFSGSGGVVGGAAATAGAAAAAAGRGRSTGGWISTSSGCGAGSADPERSSRLERPHPGRPITTDVIVKIKDAGMTVVGFSKGSQTVRKLLQRNRSAVLPFLPPEVHRGERFGRSADVYMFGILMWELYTGSVAFSNLTGTPVKLLQTIIADGVRPPWPEGTPVWYQSLASRCWAGNPKQRPSSRRIGDKLAEASSAVALAGAAAAAGWAGGGALQGVAEGM